MEHGIEKHTRCTRNGSTLRAFPTIPTASLQALTGTQSLHLRRTILTTNFALNQLSKNPYTSLKHY